MSFNGIGAAISSVGGSRSTNTRYGRPTASTARGVIGAAFNPRASMGQSFAPAPGAIVGSGTGSRPGGVGASSGNSAAKNTQGRELGDSGNSRPADGNGALESAGNQAGVGAPQATTTGAMDPMTMAALNQKNQLPPELLAKLLSDNAKKTNQERSPKNQEKANPAKPSQDPRINSQIQSLAKNFASKFDQFKEKIEKMIDEGKISDEDNQVRDAMDNISRDLKEGKFNTEDMQGLKDLLNGKDSKTGEDRITDAAVKEQVTADVDQMVNKFNSVKDEMIKNEYTAGTFLRNFDDLQSLGENGELQGQLPELQKANTEVQTDENIPVGQKEASQAFTDKVQEIRDGISEKLENGVDDASQLEDLVSAEDFKELRTHYQNMPESMKEAADATVGSLSNIDEANPFNDVRGPVFEQMYKDAFTEASVKDAEGNPVIEDGTYQLDASKYSEQIEAGEMTAPSKDFDTALQEKIEAYRETEAGGINAADEVDPADFKKPEAEELPAPITAEPTSKNIDNNSAEHASSEAIGDGITAQVEDLEDMFADEDFEEIDSPEPEPDPIEDEDYELDLE